jgi:amino acid transporter
MEKRIFVRDATGLTRPIGAAAAWMFAVGVVNIGVGGAQMFGWSQTLFPGVDISLAYTLAAVPLLFHALLYAMMGSAMPRSGGDYVWVSRIAHPVLGFTANWLFIAYLTLAVGSIMSYFSYVGLTQLFLIVGTLQQNTGLVALSQASATPPWMLGFGILLTIVIAIVLQFPTRQVFKFLWVCFVIAMAGWLTIMALLAVSSLTDFKTGFFDYTGLAYDSIIEGARNAGYNYSPGLAATIAAMPLAFLTYSGYQTTAYIAGEVKEARKGLLWSIPMSLLYGWLIYSATALLLSKTVGMEFLGSVGQLVFVAGKQPFTYTYITFIASVLTKNVFLASWICIAFIFWIVIIGVVNMFYITRCVFAWAFDRVVPTALAHVNERYNTPTYAVLVVAIGYIVGLVLTTYTPIGVFMNFGLGMSVAYAITGAVSAAFPFVKKDLYKNAPLKGPTIAGIPFMTICGVIAAGFFSSLIYLLISNPALSGPVGAVQWTFVLANVVFCVGVYYLSLAYHKRQGIDISLAFKQVPPE